MGDMVVDSLSGCPLGFGKGKTNNIAQRTNFVTIDFIFPLYKFGQ